MNDSGKSTAAINVLEANIARHPYDRDSLIALVTLLDRTGDSAKAQRYAQRLNELDSANPEARR